MQSIDIDGTAIHYRFSPGRTGERVVVFINSLGTDFRIWDDVIAELGAPYLVYDKRGHGLSAVGPTPYSMEALAQDLADLMDRLEISGAIICGLSVGGQVAQQLYHDRPDLVAGLILCDTAAKIGEPEFWQQRIATIAERGLAAVTDGIMERWFSAAFRHEGGAQYAIARAMFERQPVEGYLATCAAIAAFDRRDDAANIAVPTAVLVGSLDGATPPDVVESFAGLIDGSTFQIIDGAGHLPCIEAPHAVAAALAALQARIQ